MIRYRGADTLLFGLTDLKLQPSLSGCTSEIEASFGLGFKPNSLGAQQLLAGSHSFDLSYLEVWALVPADLLGE